MVDLQRLMYENPYGYYGIIDIATGKFGIRDVRNIGKTVKKSKEKRGSICEESGWKKPDLVRMYRDLVLSPTGELLEKIERLNRFPAALLKIPQLNDLPDEHKRYFAALYTNKVNVLCPMLRQKFEELDLLVHDTIGTARRSVVV